MNTLSLDELSSTAKGSNWFALASPPVFYRVAGKCIPWLFALAAVLTVIGLALGFLIAPTDQQQGDAYRIIFIHVPAAWLSMLIYLALSFWAAISLVFNTRIAALLARALAPTGALFTFLALWTGAFWGRATWGAWWVWDARLTSELILLFLYLGLIALQAAIDDSRRADRAGAVLALVGVVNIPIIYFSVKWWNTLHQGASVSLTAAPKMASIMLSGMLVMTLALWAYVIAIVLWRVRLLILDRERHSAWVQAAVRATS